MKRIVFAVLVCSLLTAEGASATLITSDFLVPGDHLLVTDTSTNLQYLSPVYTRGHAYDDSFVQSLISGQGFQYAAASDVLNMINNNFNNPIVGSPGNNAGFLSALSFLGVFGTNESVFCGGLACPRTQGFTGTLAGPGQQVAYGMIYLGTNGWLISNTWFDNSVDPQLGSWLVRDVAYVPEPETLLLLGAGLVGLAGWRVKKSA